MDRVRCSNIAGLFLVAGIFLTGCVTYLTEEQRAVRVLTDDETVPQYCTYLQEISIDGELEGMGLMHDSGMYEAIAQLQVETDSLNGNLARMTSIKGTSHDGLNFTLKAKVYSCDG